MTTQDNGADCLPRQLTAIDKLLLQADRALSTLAGGTATARPTPATPANERPLSEDERSHAAGLMRVNHTGEVCAQALYQGQALTAKLDTVREEMEQAAQEESDHLAWCEERVKQLNSHTSILNPVFYGLSFGLGATAGLVSDKLSLGFVSATEDQVCKHLQKHLSQLPEQDEKSRAIVATMLEDEARHGQAALEAGGIKFPAPVRGLMSLASKVMTTTCYKL